MNYWLPWILSRSSDINSNSYQIFINIAFSCQYSTCTCFVFFLNSIRLFSYWFYPNGVNFVKFSVLDSFSSFLWNFVDFYCIDFLVLRCRLSWIFFSRVILCVCQSILGLLSANQSILSITLCGINTRSNIVFFKSLSLIWVFKGVVFFFTISSSWFKSVL